MSCSSQFPFKNILMVNLDFLDFKNMDYTSNSQINEIIYMKVPAPVPGTIKVFGKCELHPSHIERILDLIIGQWLR